MSAVKRSGPEKGEAQRGCRDSGGKALRPRVSRKGRWRALALVGVHVLFALHVAHWISTGRTLSPLEPSEAMELTKHDLVNAGAIFFGLTIASTLVLGRWFCGWACHLVALQDGCRWLLGKLGIRPKPLRSRLLAWVPLIAAVYMFFWPLAYRLWVGAPVGPLRVELTKEEFWQTFPPWPVALFTFVVCGGAAVYFLGAKGFCTYACPYGALFGVVDRAAPWRIRVTDACEGCGHCTATCSSNVLVHEEVRTHGMVVDPGCMKCLDCVSVCPKEALYFGPGRPAWGKRAAGWARAKMPGREELALAAVFVLVFLALRGVYGVVPFLLALGLAGVGAAGLATLARLWRRGEVSAYGLALRRGGRLTRAGKWYAAGALGFAALVVHSGLIQAADSRARRAFEETHAAQAAFLGDPRARLAGEAAERVADGLAGAGFVERYGLLGTPGNTARLAWLELLAGEPVAFERRMRAALAEPGESAGACRALGRFLEVRGRREDAIDVYRAGLRAHPDAFVSDRLAQLLWALGRHEEACEVYREARAAEPELPILSYNLGVALASSGDLPGAAEAFREAARLDPSRPEVLENLADVLAAIGDTAGAIEGYRALLALVPDHAGARAALARLGTDGAGSVHSQDASGSPSAGADAPRREE